MKIGIIGVGHIGGVLAMHFVQTGHEVAVSNSRGPETLRDMVAELGARAKATSPQEAAEFGELVIVSVPFGRYKELPREGVSGKPVIDTNNYYPKRDGQFDDLDNDHTTSSELLQEQMRGSYVVKAFNRIGWEQLRGGGKPEARRTESRSPSQGTTPRPSRSLLTSSTRLGSSQSTEELLRREAGICSCAGRPK